jgi:hypothetical protein
MKNFFAFFIPGVLVFCLSGCGKKGDLLPPLVRIPQTVEGLQAVQRADKIVLSWINPTAYMDGSTLTEIEKIELWVLVRETRSEEVQEEVSKDTFDQLASVFHTIEKDELSAYLAEKQDSEERLLFSYPLDKKDFSSKKYTFSFRVKNRKKYSPFSDPVSVEPMILPLPPGELSAAVYRKRIEIKWSPPEYNMDQSSPARLKGYNIYRSVDEEEPVRLNETLVKEEKYDDADFEFGQKYRYFVRASGTEAPPFFESGNSEFVEILAKDTFPPDPPTGLVSVVGRDFIALSWDRNSEEDLQGYRIWRRAEGEKDFQVQSPQIIKENVFTDRAVREGIKYEYAVTALDEAGNESQKSESISNRIKKEPR